MTESVRRDPLKEFIESCEEHRSRCLRLQFAHGAEVHQAATAYIQHYDQSMPLLYELQSLRQGSIEKSSTAQLVMALGNRQGVDCYEVEPHQEYRVDVGKFTKRHDEGPALVFVVTD